MVWIPLRMEAGGDGRRRWIDVAILCNDLGFIAHTPRKKPTWTSPAGRNIYFEELGEDDGGAELW